MAAGKEMVQVQPAQLEVMVSHQNLAIFRSSERIFEHEVQNDINEKQCGSFHLGLSIIALFVIAAYVFQIDKSFYLMCPAACDMHSAGEHSDILEAYTFLGIYLGCVPWTVLMCVLGRKPTLLLGMLLHTVTVLICAFSHSDETLQTFSFFGGFIIIGPVIAIITYTYETNSERCRDTMLLMFGTKIAIASIILPMFAQITDWNSAFSCYRRAPNSLLHMVTILLRAKL